MSSLWPHRCPRFKTFFYVLKFQKFCLPVPRVFNLTPNALLDLRLKCVFNARMFRPA